jgi:hypothetical protein
MVAIMPRDPTQYPLSATGIVNRSNCEPPSTTCLDRMAGKNVTAVHLAFGRHKATGSSYDRPRPLIAKHRENEGSCYFGSRHSTLRRS